MGTKQGRGTRDASFVLVGLLIQAATTYLFLLLAGRVLGSAGFGGLTSLYLLLTGVATGLFLPLEQEVARRRGADRATEQRDDTLLRRALAFGLTLAGIAVVLALGAYPLTKRILGGEAQLVAPFVVGLTGYACWFIVRGELSGRRDLRRYGVQVGLEGLVRLVAAVSFLACGWSTPSMFGWLLALGPWFVILVTTARPGTDRGSHGGLLHRHTASFTRPVSLLVVNSLASQLLINAGPLTVSLLASESSRGRAGVFLAVIVVVRVPLFLVAAVQPGLLPAMAAHAATHRVAEFKRLLFTVLGWVGVVVAAGCIVFTTLGPPLVTWFFDFDEQLGRGTYLLLTVAVGLLLITMVLAQSLLALGRHGLATTGWVLGLIGLAVGSLFGVDAVARATYGLVAGSGVAAVAMGVLLGRELSTLTRRRVLGVLPVRHCAEE